ncbi:minor tail protein [Gordonia phage Mollymur]|uniref:Minor tail protein n=1 Tax=Gordonia phage Mollymur TaxID=2590895 RepID=A0A4Y6EBD1_9CAUD|nr:minor tail protein [Gordonia phage Mollymur]QDF15392.1 minor tail protein [Gordonia phage Mollymur]
MMTTAIGVGTAWNPQAAVSAMREHDIQETDELLDPVVGIRIFDKFYDLAEFAQDYLDLEFTLKRNGTGALALSLPGDTACRDHIFNNPDGADAIIPIVVDTAGVQWSGQIDTAAIVLDDEGVETIEITALHDWEWCNRVAMWPSPFAPLEAQFPKRMIGIGPAATIIKTFYRANLVRLQLPLWRMPALNEIFDEGLINLPAAAVGTAVGGLAGAVAGGVAGGAAGTALGTVAVPGIGSVPGAALGAAGGAIVGGVAGAAVGGAVGGLAIGQGDPNFPVAVIPSNPLRDTTKWCAVSARMQMGGELFEQVLKESGLALVARVFLPEEHEQPAPEHFTLKHPTIVLDVEDHSGVTGPTGTVIDGILWWSTELLSDMVTEIFSLSTEEEAGQDGFIADDDLSSISKWLGLRKARPDVVWLDGQYSGIISGQVTIHKPMARDIIVGGRSPGWVNSLIDVGMSLLLNYIGTIAAAPGLASIYTGQFDDILLAYQRFTDAGRALRAGPYLYHEHVVADASSAYTMDGTMSGRSGIWDTRGYTSKTVRVRDANPYIFGVDYNIGHLVGYELDGTIWTDYVTEATFRDNREERAFWEITIGDGADEEGEGVRAQRKIAGLFSIAKDLATDVGADLGLGVI